MSRVRVTRAAASVCPTLAYLLVIVALTGCTASNVRNTSTTAPMPSATPAEVDPAGACPVTEAEWAKPPEDAAVQGPPAFGYYYINQDRSIWASAWWIDVEYPLRVSEEGAKVGWFRLAGATLEITGRRLDGEAPPLEAHANCCYPTRFQASGLYFPTEGCWEVHAEAAGSELTFVVWVEP